ncbi:MAG: asparagine synthase (glutamine-hydrolyzing) [Sphingobacteriaceae bacterium]|nr:asparagine synthase (glutamine-hydrolyzing) [Sphingobacteriaceae bacterium]
MCGISGIIALKGNEIQKDLKLMNSVLFHRGPDSEGDIIESTTNYVVGFGHRRLSIIDITENAHQPMRYKNLCIVYNGEVYNFKEIKKTLEDLGHKFVTKSDTEVVIHSYEEWGSECVNHFNGMFAFAILDKDKERIFLARDRAGVKPLYYYWDKETFLFASELKAFHKVSLFKKEINPDSLALYLKYGNIPAPNAIFRNTFKLEPGFTMEFGLKEKKISKSKYWSVTTFYSKPKTTISYSQAKQATKELLRSSFEYRMIADVPVGIFLSGGYDSTCVAAMLQQNSATKIKTFTVGTDIPELNESEYAKKIAKQLGTEHYEFFCSQRESKKLASELPDYFDEPFADSSAIPTLFLSKNVKPHVKVVLSADGGDELFGGYNRYDNAIKAEKLFKVVPKGLLTVVSKLMDLYVKEKNSSGFYSYQESRWNKLRSLLKDRSNKNLLDLLSSYFNKSELESLLTNAYSLAPNAYSNTDVITDSALSYFMAVDYQTYLTDDIMQKVDRATMSTGLEAREPFLDHRVIEFVAQLPDDYKLKNGIKKYILKDIVHEFVPEAMMKRPKMGFSIPIADWLLSDMKSLIMEYLNEEKIKQHEFFNAHQVTRLVNEFLSGKKSLGLKIWNLVVFQMWYDRWMK